MTQIAQEILGALGYDVASAKPELEEIPGNPGHYWEPATLYKEVFDILKKNNWDGYICTEFEGQGAYGDLPKEQFLDEKEQV